MKKLLNWLLGNNVKQTIKDSPGSVCQSVSGNGNASNVAVGDGNVQVSSVSGGGKNVSVINGRVFIDGKEL